MNAIHVVIASALLVTPAAAGRLDTATTECIQPMMAFRHLQNEGQFLAFAGETGGGALLSLFATEEGTFTIVVVGKDSKDPKRGNACFVTSGFGWTTMEPEQVR